MTESSDRPVLTLAELESFDPSAPERGRERRFCCPLPGCADKRLDARHRSLSVNVESGRWHCHRCGAGGVLRERWSPHQPRFNPKRASSRRAFAVTKPEGSSAKHALSGAPASHRSTGQPHWRQLFECASTLGGDRGAAYLDSRGISREVASTADVRYNASWPHWSRTPSGEWILAGTSRRVVFPIRDPTRRLVAIQGRVITANDLGPKVVTRGNLSLGVFLTDPHVLEAPLIAVVEAPIDALSLALAGIPSVALCGTNLPEWLPQIVAFRTIVLAFDADPAGDQASVKAANAFRAFGCDLERWRPICKDWNEVLTSTNGDGLADALARCAGPVAAQ